MRTYKAVIVPTISGGNIEVKISANSVQQAVGLIESLPYFRSFAKRPVCEDDNDNNLTRISDLIKKANAKKQAELGKID